MCLVVACAAVSDGSVGGDVFDQMAAVPGDGTAVMIGVLTAVELLFMHLNNA